ncbi:MAG: ABC transporter substrate binding protein [Humidesulfovibrio sp.]|nr:ABC transporter substrate binding protein [Humidesulfovibrio sp.]
MRRMLFLLLTSLLGLCGPGMAPAQAGPRVVVVHSYNAEYVWVREINRGIQESLRGLNASITTYYMDAQRDPDPGHLRAKGQEFLARIEALKPQVVIAADDAAQEYLVAPFLKGRAQPQVIFCGVNAPVGTYGFPAENVSGVRERWHFREGFALLHKIKPSLQTVVLLSDDSPSASYVLDNLREDREQGLPPLPKLLKVVQVHTYQEWQRAVRFQQTRSQSLALGMYHSLVDERTGKVVPADTVSAWTNGVNRLPTLGFADYAKGHGQMCGILESGREQGALAGGMARQVLTRGVRAGSLPVKINKQGIVLLNLKTAERLGVVIPFEIIQAAEIVVK